MHTSRPRNAFLASALALLLASCATTTTNDAHRNGVALLQQGRYEEALANLEEAVRQSPGNHLIRKDFIVAREEAGNRFVAAGNGARAAGRFDLAEQAYQQALRVDPGNGRAATGLEALKADRRHDALIAEAEDLLKKDDLAGATARLMVVLLENANHGRALQLQRQINARTAQDTTAEPALSANFKKPVTLQFRDANLRMVLESLSRTAGINILLDRDVRPDLRTTIFARGTSIEDTIGLILIQNQLRMKVLSGNTIFIYPNVPAKNRDYQDLKVRSFHLVHADAKQVQAMLRTILKTRDLYINEKTNSIVMRDTPEAIRLAEKLVADQDIADPEVMLEVEVLEVTRTRLTELGIRFPDQINLTPPVAPGAALNLGNVRDAFGSSDGRNTLVVTPVPTVTLNAHLDTTNANVLASPRIRVRNREKAKIHIGDRVPVLTNSVTPVATGAPVVTGTVSYIEVGLKLDVEPDIHGDAEVGIKVAMEVSNIVREVTNPVSGTIAYQLRTRNASTILRLKDGETQVLAGLINDDDRRTANMVPGLGELPVLGRLFSTHGSNLTKTEIVLSITPRLVGRTRLQEARLIEYWSGSETAARSTLFSLRETGTVAVTPAPGTALPPQPTAPAQTTPLPPRPETKPAPALPPTSLIWQGPAQAKVGERFTLTLQTPGADPFRNLDLLLSYDPAALRAVDAFEGSILKQQNIPSTFRRDINQPNGQISVEVAGAPTDAPRGRRAGSVAAITFEVIGASPRSEITLERVAWEAPSGDVVAVAPPSPHAIVLNR